MHDAWFSAWAKTGRDPQDKQTVVGWLPLHQHLADTAAVAGRLVDEWVSPQVVRQITDDLGGDVGDVRFIVSWLAAVHDDQLMAYASRTAPGACRAAGTSSHRLI